MQYGLQRVCCRSCYELTVGRHSRQEVLFTVTIAAYTTVAVLVIALEHFTIHFQHSLLNVALSHGAGCLQVCASILSMKMTYNGMLSKRTGTSFLPRTRTGIILCYGLACLLVFVRLTWHSADICTKQCL